MERDGTGQLSTIYTYGNQRINSESYNNLSGLYTYDGRGSVSAVIGGYGDFRASYWYDGLGNVKSQIHGYGAFGSGKKYYGYNAEQYNPVTGNQNLRARQVNIIRQRFLTEDSYIGNKTDILSINRYTYARSNPLRYIDPNGNDYTAAVWLLNENGAQAGPIIAGHAAIMLVDDEDNAEYYSYAASDETIWDKAKAVTVGSQGYLSTVIDEKHEITSISFSDYIVNKNGVIINSDDINNRNIQVRSEQYTYAIYIPINNEQGIVMHDKALEIRENAGTYQLFNHNCNQVAQEILSAGGKDFAPNHFDWLDTMPNNVRNNLIRLTQYAYNPYVPGVSMPSNANTSYWDWKFGTIEELSKQLLILNVVANMRCLINFLIITSLIILVVLINGCVIKDLSILDKNMNMDFTYSDNLNIVYEYGKNNDKKIYRYNSETKILKEDIISNLFNNKNFYDIVVNDNTGEKIDFVYDDEEKKKGIFYLDNNDAIIKEIVTWDYLKKRFKFFNGMSQLLYESQNNKLYFHASSSNEILVSINLTNNNLTEIVNYVPIYYQYYYNSNYILNNNKIFVIDTSNNINIYDTTKEELVNTHCNAYNFIISNDGQYIYYINLNNELCMYNVNNSITKTLFVVNNRVERLDINKTNEYLLLVETLDKLVFTGIDTSAQFKQNELNLYEISTGEKITIQKPSLFNVVFDAKFVDE